MKNRNGYTLVEVLITLGLSVLLVALAVPSATSLWHNNLVQSQLHILHKTLNKARRYAIRENSITVTCSLDQSLRCSSTMTNTLDVFADFNNNKALDAGESRLYQIKIHPELLVIPRLSAGRNYISYLPMGVTNGTFGSIQLCQPAVADELKRAVVIARTGRLRVSQDTDSNGIHNAGSRDICSSDS